jgi:hypothetical protein
MKMVLSVSRSCVLAETQKDIDVHGTFPMGCNRLDEIVVVGTLQFFQSSTSHKDNDKEGSAGIGAGKISVSLSQHFIQSSAAGCYVSTPWTNQ